MSLVWTIIAGFLYAEIALVLLLVLPIASPQKWSRFFKSRFLAMLEKQAQMYFYLLLGILVIFLLEAIREMRKYSTQEAHSETHLNLEMQHSMRLFRAQRNFYISGFAIFLVFVIRRLILLINQIAKLLAESEASLKQAQSATNAAKNLMSSKKGADNNPSSVDEIKRLRERVQELSSSLNHEKKKG